MHAIVLELQGRKARKQVEVRRTLGVQSLGKLGQDLGQPLFIPDWMIPVHRRGNGIVRGGVGSAGIDEGGQKVLEHGLDLTRHGCWTIRGSQEVGHAGHDDDVALLAHGRGRAERSRCSHKTTPANTSAQDLHNN